MSVSVLWICTEFGYQFDKGTLSIPCTSLVLFCTFWFEGKPTSHLFRPLYQGQSIVSLVVNSPLTKVALMSSLDWQHAGCKPNFERRCQECLTSDEEKKAVTCRSTASWSHVHQNILYNTVLYIYIYLYMFSPCIATWGPSATAKLDTDGYGWIWGVGCVARVPITSHLGKFSFAAQTQLAVRPSHPSEWNDHMALAFPCILQHFATFRQGRMIAPKNWISDTLQLQSQPGKCLATLQIIQQKIPACVFFQSPLSIPYNINNASKKPLQHIWIIQN